MQGAGAISGLACNAIPGSPGNAAPLGAGEDATPPATQFLDLGDDIFAKIYASLEESSDKKALRHSCTTLYRSPAVNIHLGTLNIRKSMGRDCWSKVEDVMGCLASFPTHATLKTLVLARMDIKSVLKYALGSEESSEAVRDKCRSVSTVVLEDFSPMPDVVIAELMPSLFPKMQGCSSGGALLRAQFCWLHLDFCNILSTHSQLDGLELIQCRFLGTTDDHLAGSLGQRLATFTSLSSLSITCYKLGMVLDCNDLFQLQRLHTLKLSNVHLNTFEVLLENLPNLRTLHLSIARFPPGGVHLQSNSVQTLVLGSLSPIFPEVSYQNFPALKSFDFWALDLATVPNNLEERKKVQLVERMADWLAKCPLVTGCTRMRSIDDEVYDVLRVKPSWSAELCEAMFPALQPLKEKFAGVRHFRAEYWNLTGPASMTKLLGFLRDVESISLEKCKFGDAALEGGFLEAFNQLPRLRKLVLDVDVPPRDMLAVLTAAQLAGRPFEVVLHSGNSNSSDQVRAIEKEWQFLRKTIWPGSELEENPIVHLHVRGFYM